MSAIESQPTNLNYLSPLGFRFMVKKLPNVNYFCQVVTLPNISMNVIESTTPFSTIPRVGDKLIYDPLTIRFRVDEDLKNYLEIHNWLVGLGHPQSFTQTRNLSASSDMPKLKEGSASSFMSDGTLVVLNSHKNPSYYVFFRDIFPISLSELSFDSTQTDVDYLEASVTMRYLRYEFEAI